MTQVDTSSARTLLLTALDLLDRIGEPALPEDPVSVRQARRRDGELALASRDLFYATHLCRRAGTELEAQYWVLRGGHPDVLGDERAGPTPDDSR